MKPGRALLIAVIACTLVYGLIFGLYYYVSAKKSADPKKLAIESLKAVVDCPDDVVIDAVSKPIPIKGRVYVTDMEVNDLSSKLAKFSEALANKTSSGTYEDFSDPELQSMMSRQMNAVNSLQSLNMTPDKANKQTGWKIKIQYHSKYHDGTPYKAEYWAITDMDSKFVLNSFEIPLL